MHIVNWVEHFIISCNYIVNQSEKEGKAHIAKAKSDEFKW